MAIGPPSALPSSAARSTCTAFMTVQTSVIHCSSVGGADRGTGSETPEPRLSKQSIRLGTFSRMLCFDKRGSGVSDPVPLSAPPTLEQWMTDVCTVMNAVHVERAALLGSAEGGPMAMLFAATYPERTSALILIDTSARVLRDTDSPWGLPVD